MNRIKLDSRYGDKNYLDEVSPNIYKLTAEYNYRVGFDNVEDKELTFVDPSGGPFITVGFEIGSKVVTRVFRGDNNEVLIELKDDISCNK